MDCRKTMTMLVVLPVMAVAGLAAGPGAKAPNGPPAPWSAEWVGPLDPVVIDGKAWTFHTPPPPRNEWKVSPEHPRILLTRAHLPDFREKMKHPAYKGYLAELVETARRGDACANALLYHLGGPDKEAHGRKAKELVLAGKFPVWGGMEGGIGPLGAVCAYDWTADLLTAEEKKAAFKKVRATFAWDKPWTHQGWYGNDPYCRMQGFAYQALCVFAGFGDGADDEWCERMRAKFYEEDPATMGMYGPNKGQGLLDVLNSIALDTGGSQAGDHGDNPTSGYTAMYLCGAPILLAGWAGATGEPVLRQCNWLRLLPHWLAYESNPWPYKGKGPRDGFQFVPAGIGSAVLEYMTGLYKDIDPDMAALAAWQVKQFGTYRYAFIPRLVLGDLRTPPKSPADLKLPTARYLRGADGFFSMSSWEPGAGRVRFQVRYLDTNRYEPDTNVFTISRFGRLAAGGRHGKMDRSGLNHSGLWFHDPASPGARQGSTYWGGLRWRADRALGAREVAEKPDYRAGGPLAVGVHDGYRFATADAARLLSVEGARRYERTIVHLPPIGADREYVIVHDRTEAAGGVKRVWNLRTITEPTAEVAAERKTANHLLFPGARRFTVTNRMGNCHGVLHMTVVLPEKVSAQWRGGVGHEGEDPEGKNYISPRSDWVVGYAAQPALQYKYGLGNLFIEAAPTPPVQNYLMVMQIGDANALPAEKAAKVARLAGAGNDAIQVDEWAVVFAAGPARRGTVAYTLAADAARHVVFDLEPGAYMVAKNGQPLADTLHVADRDFSLGFSAAGKAGEEFSIRRKG